MHRVLKSRSSAATDVGHVRENNEDRYFCDDELQLYVVADGMGGHAAGEVAAELAVNAVSEFIRSGQKLVNCSVDQHDDAVFLTEFVQAAIEHAATEVHQLRRRYVECENMGTTLTVLLIVREFAVIGHVGDSRAYLVRDNHVDRLTRDHTARAFMIDEGLEPSAISRRFDHLLLRSIGHQMTPEIDMRVESVCEGDRFLLCTDGLSNHFSDDELSAIIDSEQELPVVVENLVTVGKMVGGEDNLTAVLVEATSEAVDHPLYTGLDRMDECLHRALHSTY